MKLLQNREMSLIGVKFSANAEINGNLITIYCSNLQQSIKILRIFPVFTCSEHSVNLMGEPIMHTLFAELDFNLIESILRRLRH